MNEEEAGQIIQKTMETMKTTLNEQAIRTDTQGTASERN